VITIGKIERGIRQQEGRDPAFARDLRGWLDRTVLLFSDLLLPFKAEDARICGALSANISHARADLMIGAWALRHGVTVVTGNVSVFAPTGVRTEAFGSKAKGGGDFGNLSRNCITRKPLPSLDQGLLNRHLRDTSASQLCPRKAQPFWGRRC
jgi:hypothetical protein